ncbi:MAG: molecular chaperone DnaJ [Armatimonadetes bacterium]|nr:molecular chaperone DnaJ [Armatimonadota bacterium]
MPRDYYDVLGVARDATADQIKQAYRRLAREHHPDVRRDDPHAEERFKEINEAFGILSDERRRSRYDRFGHAASNARTPEGFDGAGFGGSPFEDLFDAFFGGAGRGPAPRSEPGPESGADLGYTLPISLEEAARGVEREIEFARMETCSVCFGTGSERGGGAVTCPTCSGSGQVRHVQRTALGMFTQIVGCRQCGGAGQIIRDPCQRCGGGGRTEAKRSLTVKVPVGVEDGMQLRLAGEGEAGLRGGRRGDLYVKLRIAEHPTFGRRGTDLFVEVPISMAQAALGDELEIPTLDGGERHALAAGTQPSERATLRGKGMPDLKGRRGDLHVTWRVEIPTALSRDQAKTLQEFAKLRGEKIAPKKRKIIEKVKEILQ